MKLYVIVYQILKKISIDSKSDREDFMSLPP